MVIAELIALIVIMSLIGFGIYSFVSFVRSVRESNKRQAVKKELMKSDLRDALRSENPKRLEDWLIMYSTEADPEQVSSVKDRINELTATQYDEKRFEKVRVEAAEREANELRQLIAKSLKKDSCE